MVSEFLLFLYSVKNCFGCDVRHTWLEMCVLVAQLCLTLRDPMDCGLLGSVHGIFQAKILEWVAISFSRGSSQPRDWTQVSCTAARFFTIWATREVLICNIVKSNKWGLTPFLQLKLVIVASILCDKGTDRASCPRFLNSAPKSKSLFHTQSSAKTDTIPHYNF